MAFTPRRTTKYNETFFRGMGGPGPTAVGIIVILLIVFGFYLAFAKRLPFSDRGYQLQATFANSANIRKTSPVRIAGVNVGEVTGVERKGEPPRSPSPSRTRVGRSTRTPRPRSGRGSSSRATSSSTSIPGAPARQSSRTTATIPITTRRPRSSSTRS